MSAIIMCFECFSISEICGIIGTERRQSTGYLVGILDFVYTMDLLSPIFIVVVIPISFHGGPNQHHRWAKIKPQVGKSQTNLARKTSKNIGSICDSILHIITYGNRRQRGKRSEKTGVWGRIPQGSTMNPPPGGGSSDILGDPPPDP
jgi:hypothetical protein